MEPPSETGDWSVLCPALSVELPLAFPDRRQSTRELPCQLSTALLALLEQLDDAVNAFLWDQGMVEVKGADVIC